MICFLHPAQVNVSHEAVLSEEENLVKYFGRETGVVERRSIQPCLFWPACCKGYIAPDENPHWQFGNGSTKDYFCHCQAWWKNRENFESSVIDIFILSQIVCSINITPTTAKSSQKLPKVAKSCQKLPKVAKSCQKLPKAAKSCQNLPKVVKSCQELPKAAKSC